MPGDVGKKEPDQAVVWIFQEAEAVRGSEGNIFNSRAEICTLISQTHLTLEVKALASLASVTGNTATKN